MTISEIIKLSGMGNAEFARTFGIPIRTIENWKSGVNNPPEYVVRLLEMALAALKK